MVYGPPVPPRVFPECRGRNKLWIQLGVPASQVPQSSKTSTIKNNLLYLAANVISKYFCIYIFYFLCWHFSFTSTSPSFKKFPFLFLGCSKVTPGSQLRNYSWWYLGNIWDAGTESMLLICKASALPTCCIISLAPSLLIWSSNFLLINVNDFIIFSLTAILLDAT